VGDKVKLMLPAAPLRLEPHGATPGLGYGAVWIVGCKQLVADRHAQSMFPAGGSRKEQGRTSRGSMGEGAGIKGVTRSRKQDIVDRSPLPFEAKRGNPPATSYRQPSEASGMVQLSSSQGSRSSTW
jgi:hypothetical protein